MTGFNISYVYSFLLKTIGKVLISILYLLMHLWSFFSILIKLLSTTVLVYVIGLLETSRLIFIILITLNLHIINSWKPQL